MKRMVKELWEWFLCDIMKDHDWTCAAAEEIEPTPLQCKTGMEGARDYAKMYCKRCGKLPEHKMLKTWKN